MMYPNDVSQWCIPMMYPNGVSRAVKLTDGMEEVFVQNYANDHFIFAQYFGSTSGLLRYFPAYYWETNNQVNGITHATN